MVMNKKEKEKVLNANELRLPVFRWLLFVLIHCFFPFSPVFRQFRISDLQRRAQLIKADNRWWW